MAFKAAFIAHAPDADPEKHNGIHSVLLCPEVGVNVARGDGPANRVAVEALQREWGFP